MGNSRFFEEITEQSLIKTSIVTKYFNVWAGIMVSNRKRYGGERIGYFDLFCGPGLYDDGTKSSPLLVLENAVADPDLRKHLVTFFIDQNSDYIKALSQEVKSIPNIGSLAHQPIIEVGTVDDYVAEHFEDIKLIPSLVFLDPWGYKGLSLRLINSFLKDQGSECIFFFNYRRINAALDNPKFEKLVEAIFGLDRSLVLQEAIKDLDPAGRESTIMSALEEALTEEFGRFVLPFKFKNETGTRTSHYLVFVSKHPKGYEIMKNIMAKHSTPREQQVPSFQFTSYGFDQTGLFAPGETIEELSAMLLDTFRGQTLAMVTIFEQHHVGRRYIKRNYKEALLQLEMEGKIATDRPKRKKGTFADDVRVSFPNR